MLFEGLLRKQTLSVLQGANRCLHYLANRCIAHEREAEVVYFVFLAASSTTLTPPPEVCSAKGSLCASYCVHTAAESAQHSRDVASNLPSRTCQASPPTGSNCKVLPDQFLLANEAVAERRAAFARKLVWFIHIYHKVEALLPHYCTNALHVSLSGA